MFWRIIGIGSLGWGATVFYILSTTSFPESVNVPIAPSLEFTINVLSLGWLVTSSLVKVGLILKRRWLRISILSCLCFLFLLVNMGLLQTGTQAQMPAPEEESVYPYNLVALWFISWFWIDAFLLITSFMNWMMRRRLSSP